MVNGIGCGALPLMWEHMELIHVPAHLHSVAFAGNYGDLNASRAILLLIILGKASS